MNVERARLPCLQAILALAGAVLSALEAGERQADSLAKAALVGYAANLSSFPHYACRFRVTEGQAQSLEDALAGKLVNAHSFENLYIADGDMQMLEGFALLPDDTKGVRVGDGKGGGVTMVRSPGNSSRYLGHGKRALSYTPGLKSASLTSAEKGARQPIDLHPLVLLGWSSKNPLHKLPDQTDRYTYSAIGLEEFAGRPVVTIRLDHKREKRRTKPKYPPFDTVHDTYSFDPAWGHLLVLERGYWDNELIDQTIVTDAIPCSNGRWFPGRILLVDPGSTSSKFRVREFKVLELDADRKPALADFTIAIPAGTPIMDANDVKKTFFRLRQDEQINVADIPQLYRMLDEVRVNPLMDTAILRPGPWWTKWAWGTAAVGFLSVGGYYLWRRPRARTTPGAN